MPGSPSRQLETWPVNVEAAQLAVVEAARKVAASRWSEFHDPISTGRRNLIELTLAVADLDSFGIAAANKVTR
jgi:hypothetical protein